MIGENATQAAGRPIGAISTLVSLFLLLLVFFIVLFSIAEVKRVKVDAVLDGLDAAFAHLPSKLGVWERPVADPGDLGTTEGFLRAVTTLVGGIAPLAEIPRQAQGGSLFEIDLGTARLFAADSPLLLAEIKPMLDRLAVLLQQEVEGQRYRLTFRALVPAATPVGGPVERLALARAAAVAAALFNRGCPPDGLAVGLERSDTVDGAGGLRLDFSLLARPAGE